MDRRRFLQAALTISLILFLLVLVFKFRPKVEGPRPVTLQGTGAAASGTLTTRDFRYTQESAGQTAFVLTAEQMVERPGESRALTNPRLSMPGSGGETVLTGTDGLFDPATKTLRVFGDAVLRRPDGWTAASTGFRMTPEGELLAEQTATFHRGALSGRADLMRYQRDAQRAFLEGTVRIEDGGGHTLTCSRISLDLKTHGGTLAGPVKVSSSDGTIDAPAGEIALTEENTLHEVRLGSPSTGEGPSGRFRSEQLALSFGSGGEVAKVALEGAARLEAVPTGEVVETARVDLAPAGGDRWTWNAPGALKTTRGADFMNAPSGSGALGAGKPFTALLPGPVSGDGPSGRWRADRATVEGRVRTLLGTVNGERPGETLQADEVRLEAGGSSTAEGHVRGTRAAPGAAPLRFVSDKAVSAPGGYPITLSGSAVVTRGEASVAAPAVKVSDPDTAEATGGAVCKFRGAEGEETLAAPTVRYEGKQSRATASGGSVGQGRGYTLKADQVVAALDAKGRPQGYEARGMARLTGTAYDAEGDRLTWRPGGRSGTASSETGRAVVTEKNPYRRVEGPEVAFDDKAVTVTGVSSSRRGYLEAVPAPPKAPAAPAPPPAKRSTDGR